MEYDANSLDNASKDVISKFNEAKLQLMRLNYSWIKCSQYASGGDLVSWKWELDNVFRELSADCKSGDDEKNERLRRMISLAEKRGNKSLLYRILEQRQIFLRSIQENSGKGSSKHHSDEDTFD